MIKAVPLFCEIVKLLYGVAIIVCAPVPLYSTVLPVIVIVPAPIVYMLHILIVPNAANVLFPPVKFKLP